MTPDTTQPAGMRTDYTGHHGLVEADLAAHWHEQFDRWFVAAVRAGLPEPNAMVVATADAAGRPSARTVLLKEYDADGLVFFTNYESRKGVEALGNPYASLVFPWFPMHRQVVVTGTVAPVSRARTENYFAGRPRGSQLGAWASPQSRPLAGRAELDGLLAAAERRFPPGTPVPAPPHWGGLIVVPQAVEFWQGRPDRMHDRLRYRRRETGDWLIERLAP